MRCDLQLLTDNLSHLEVDSPALRSEDLDLAVNEEEYVEECEHLCHHDGDHVGADVTVQLNQAHLIIRDHG